MNPTQPFHPGYRRRRVLTGATGAVALAVTCSLAYASLGSDARSYAASAPERLQRNGSAVASPGGTTVIIKPQVIVRDGAPVTVPGGATAPAQQPAASVTKAVPVAGPVWSGFASAAGAYVGRASTGADDIFVAPHSLAMSAAGSATGQKLQTKDSLGQVVYTGPTNGTTAFALGAPVHGLDQVTTGVPAAHAASPTGNGREHSATIDPDTPPVTLTSIGGSAQANTVEDSTCVLDKPLSTGAAQSASTGLLELDTTGSPIPFVDDKTVSVATSDSRSSTSLAPASTFTGKLLPSVTAVISSAKVWLPEMNLFSGTDREIRIRFFQPVQLVVTAGGVPGTAFATYQPVSTALRGRFFEVLAGGEATSYTYLQGKGFQGVSVATPFGSLTIAAPAKVEARVDGTSVAASADLVSISLPTTGARALPSTLPGHATVDSALSAALKALDYEGSTVGVRELRYGHLEATAAVPAGGVRCLTKTPFSNDDGQKNDPNAPDAPPARRQD